MRRPAARAVGLLLGFTLAGSLTACGGGFSDDAPPPDRTLDSYVALGDGFTAAPSTGATSDEDCGRSKDNYPALLANELGIHDVRDVSCTGATTDSIVRETKPAKGGETLPPQLEALTRDTDLVTIGAGIEDDDILRRAFEICTAYPCASQVAGEAVVNDVQTAGSALTGAVRKIQAKSPNAYIVLVGYPVITPSEHRCAKLPKLDALGLDAANAVFAELNRQIQSAARQTGAAFLDTAALTAGHDVCAADPWVTAATSQPGRTADFRPVAAEQRAVSQALADLVRSR